VVHRPVPAAAWYTPIFVFMSHPEFNMQAG
jgi:hypothetical protein